MKIHSLPEVSRREFRPGLLLLLLVLLFLPALSAAETVCDHPLVVGWESWEPFQYKEKDELKGSDIEILRAVARDMGCEIRFRELPWTRHLEEIKKGQIDIACGVAKTAERQAFGKFSVPYRQDEVRLWVRIGERDSHPYEDLAALAASDFKLGVIRSYVYGPVFADLVEARAFQEEYLIQVDSMTQLVPMLARKRIDGFLAERSNFVVQTRQQGLEGKFEAHPVSISEDSAFFLFSRESISDEVLAAFNLSLEELRESGTLDAIHAKYLQ